MQSKQEQFPHERLRLDKWVGMQCYVSQNSGAGIEGELNNPAQPHSTSEEETLKIPLSPNFQQQ
jgi:hypothetical protein